MRITFTNIKNNKKKIKLRETVKNLFSMYNSNIHSIIENEQTEINRISEKKTKNNYLFRTVS